MKTSNLTRRRLLLTAAATPGIIASMQKESAFAQDEATAGDEFAFPLLGDLHFDRLEHHDLEWMKTAYPNDIRQVENYSRITAEVTPKLFESISATVADSNRTPQTRVPFVLHIGDLVEGLCGSETRASRQNQDAIAFVRAAQLNAPFLFCKGNHDITGPGAREAFVKDFLPFLTHEAEKTAPLRTAPLQNAFYALEHGSCLFAQFDAYDREDSLDWLETTLAQSKAHHKFVLIHPPVVPYGARTTWHIYAKPAESAQRARLLNLLGRHRAIVLSGHLHKYNLMTRRTDEGRFVQLAVCSVIPKVDEKPGDILQGVAAYTPDQIAVEPRFNPDTEAERRAIITAEAPFVESFEYADAPGYAVIKVTGERIIAEFYRGAERTLWKTRDLTALLDGKDGVVAETKL